MKISDNTAVSMPMRNLLSILGAVIVGVWFAFTVIERLNSVETRLTLLESDLIKNTEFRIKWPRGEMGSLPADSEQFMLIEHIAKQVEVLQKEVENGRYNSVNLDFLKGQVEKLQSDVEKLIRNGH
tara:strand:+ start:11 stop:388 length:378 start_codon:yes stop_codon:yes gene_type:complete